MFLNPSNNYICKDRSVLGTGEESAEKAAGLQKEYTLFIMYMCSYQCGHPSLDI